MTTHSALNSSAARISSGQPVCTTQLRSNGCRLALALSGGGARAAYQVGFLRSLATEFPDFSPDVLTGVSAGAINAAYLAVHPGSFRDRIEALADLWASLTIDDVFRVDIGCLARNVTRWGARLLSGGSRYAPQVRSLVDTRPLDALLERVLDAKDDVLTGIDRNIASGSVSAVALTASSYATGQSITWVRGCEIRSWERPDRQSISGPLTVQHVMASSALPLLFPAVEVDATWYGDGGVGLTAPLSPSVHLGADRILAISTRATRRDLPSDRVDGYPSPARVAGLLLDAIFVDSLEADAQRLERINDLLAVLPDEKHRSLRHIDLHVARPSEDLGCIAREYEPRLPTGFRFLTRGLGTREPPSGGVLSMLMFQPDYIRRLLDLGEADAAARAREMRELLTAA
jgi:NTE family protein